MGTSLPLVIATETHWNQVTTTPPSGSIMELEVKYVLRKTQLRRKKHVHDFSLNAIVTFGKVRTMLS